ncbi:MAG: ABC transporter ATP-binding protein [Syntrophales bacterium]|jgi:zinc transport system ATP-binding protein|nr:ABC transporter ATP-binding protein [Syntrophales bacterium]MCK9527820.1 ABC transporter ATP-binding protein [Syntrophales bacterium]MDX9922083.1 ABC transporter ATP-binding protein [Syntrophales bacterium]
MNSHPAIEISNVFFDYNGVPVLEKVTLSIEKGDFVSIVGPNGGGKTTLIKLILGLLVPREGTVRVFGRSPLTIRHAIGYMPQAPSLDPRFPVTVTDVVSMGLLGTHRSLGFSQRSSRDRIVEALGKLGVESLQDSPFSELSGGQRQRVLIARALVKNPELLILDEPTSSVDIVAEQALFDMLDELNRVMTIVVVSHDVGFVSHYVKTVACVNRRVVVHPTSEITGEIISEIYGADVRMIRHDETSSERGCRV